MRTDVLERQFSRIGAKVEFEDKKVRNRHKKSLIWFEKYFSRKSRDIKSVPTLPKSPSLDIKIEKKDEIFVIDTFDNPRMDIHVLDTQPDIKHLLLMIREEPSKNAKQKISKYLCGHDERHWFVAAVPEDAYAKNVSDAMSALKPELAISSQLKSKVKNKNKNKRRNKGYKRQGEWFFIPDDIDIGKSPTHKNEPIVRSTGGKPHICEEVYRIGGVLVYLNSKYIPEHSGGITQQEFNDYMKEHPKNRAGWNKMVRDAKVYARGLVKHPDHKTIYLTGWHKVIPNTEDKALAMQHVVFLD